MECHLCNCRHTSVFLKKQGYRLDRCDNCGLIFLDFRKNYTKILKEYYNEGYFAGDPAFVAYSDYLGDRRVIVKNMRNYLKEILQYQNKGRLLDVGCAMGFLMEEAERVGFQSYGVDVSPYAIAEAKKKFGKRALLTPLSEINFSPGLFSVVTLFDVVEHLQNPLGDLKKVKKVLRDDGLLVIETGDAGSIWARLMGRKWIFYAPPQHLFYFDRKTMRRLLEQADFEVLAIRRKGKWLSLRYILQLARTSGGSKLADFLYKAVSDNSLGRFPLYIKLWDNMVVFAKKG